MQVAAGVEVLEHQRIQGVQREHAHPMGLRPKQ